MRAALRVSIVSTIVFFVASSGAFADKLCLQTTVNRKNLRATSKSLLAPRCPKGFTELIDTLKLQAPAGAQGAAGPKGDKGDRGDMGPKGDPGPGVSWVEASSATRMEANIGYIVNGGKQVDLTLPSNLAVGDIVQIRGGKLRTPWRILPGTAGQVIQGFEGIAAAGRLSWRSMDVSADGQRLVGVVGGGSIYTSTDSGISWTERKSAGQRQWETVASSDDGMTLIAGGYGFLYTSSDGGETWAQRTAADYQSDGTVVSSADGTKVMWASRNEAFLFTSQDGGDSWTKCESAGQGDWSSIASSADGLKLAGLRHNYENDTQQSRLMVSEDGGATWTSKEAPAGFIWGWTISLSSDGRTIITGLGNQFSSPRFVAISTDGGATWVKRAPAGEKDIEWIFEVASSTDGQTIYATLIVDGETEVYRSVDTGNSWAMVFSSAMQISGLRINASGSTFYGILPTDRKWINSIFSSGLTAFTELKGYGNLKLIYLGENTFGRE
jgi:photosystem II stability/assembly factor-like uncharacterized protein